MTLVLDQDTYLIRRKFLKLAGNEFRVFDAAGNQVLFSRQKAFKLREDIRVWTGEDMQTEVLSIRARTMMDFAAAYDVVDSTTGEKVGALKRRGLKSMLRDEWILMDVADRDIGRFQEDSMVFALVRRVVNFVPQHFHVELGDAHVASMKQNWNPFLLKMTVDFTPDTRRLLDRRLGIAAAILHSAIEGKQG